MMMQTELSQAGISHFNYLEKLQNEVTPPKGDKPLKPHVETVCRYANEHFMDTKASGREGGQGIAEYY